MPGLTDTLQNSQAPSNVTDASNATNSQMGIGGLPDPTQGMADIISTAAGLDLSQTQPVGKADVLPPSYYTPDMSRPLIIGGTASLPYHAVGIPMFSMSILQQADEQVKEAKRLKYVSDMKDADNLMKSTMPLLINDDLKQSSFLNWQNNEWETLIKNGLEKYGVSSYKNMKRDIALKGGQIKAVKQAMDSVYEQAKQIHALGEGASLLEAGGKGKGEFYVSPVAKKMAEEYLEWSMSDEMKNMPYNEIIQKTGEYKKFFTKQQSLSESTKDVVKGLNGLVTTDVDSGEFDQWGNTRYKVSERKTGLAALDDFVGDRYEDNLKTAYETYYGDENENKDLKPSYDMFKKYALMQIKSEIKPVFTRYSKSTPRVGGGSGSKKELVSRDQSVVYGGRTYTAQDAIFLPTKIPYKLTEGYSEAYNMETGVKEDVLNSNFDINGVANYGGYTFVSMSKPLRTEVGTVYENYVMPLTNTIKGEIDNKYNYTGSYQGLGDDADIEEANKVLAGIPKGGMSGLFKEKTTTVKPKTTTLPIGGNTNQAKHIINYAISKDKKWKKINYSDGTSQTVENK
jgi:hypothetical protein